MNEQKNDKFSNKYDLEFESGSWQGTLTLSKQILSKLNLEK